MTLGTLTSVNFSHQHTLHQELELYPAVDLGADCFPQGPRGKRKRVAQSPFL